MPVLSPDRTVVVAGNGPSVADIAPGQILADDVIIRVNNFFFEPRTWLGKRVDLLVAGGDPRVAPFLMETLKSCLSDYQITAWTAFNPRVVTNGQKILPLSYRDFPVFADPAFARQAQDIMGRYERVKPLTGTYALLMAYAAGARRFVLTGMDLYSSETRYFYQPGPHQRALLGGDLAERGLDGHLHDHRLDLELISLLADQNDVQIQHAHCAGYISDHLALAPIRKGAPVAVRRRHAPTDWSSRSGCYPIRLLRLMRRVRTWQRKLARSAA